MEDKLLTLINRDWTNPGLDALMAVMSSLQFWMIPMLVLAALIAIFGRFRDRAFLVVLTLAICVSDSLVANTLKHTVKRPRPNEVVADVRIISLNFHRSQERLMALFLKSRQNLGMTKGTEDGGWVRVATSRPDPDQVGGRSFPSSHTMNNFCAAMVLSVFFRRWGWLYFFPAALIGYSRVYVGSHWPSDVAISSVMGIGVALLLLALLESLWKKCGSRWMPRLFARHPSLWEKTPAPMPAAIHSPS